MIRKKENKSANITCLIHIHQALPLSPPSSKYIEGTRKNKRAATNFTVARTFPPGLNAFKLPPTSR